MRSFAWNMLCLHSLQKKWRPRWELVLLPHKTSEITTRRDKDSLVWCCTLPKWPLAHESAFAFSSSSPVVQLGSPDLHPPKGRGGDPKIKVIVSKTSANQHLSPDTSSHRSVMFDVLCFERKLIMCVSASTDESDSEGGNCSPAIAHSVRKVLICAVSH